MPVVDPDAGRHARPTSRRRSPTRRERAARCRSRRSSVATGRSIGSTRYLNIEPAHRRLEIGYTWIAPRVAAQRRQHRGEAADAAPRVQRARRAARRVQDGLAQRAVTRRRCSASARPRRGRCATTWSRRAAGAGTRSTSASIEEEWPRVRQHLEARLARTPARCAEKPSSARVDARPDRDPERARRVRRRSSIDAAIQETRAGRAEPWRRRRTRDAPVEMLQAMSLRPGEPILRAAPFVRPPVPGAVRVDRGSSELGIDVVVDVGTTTARSCPMPRATRRARRCYSWASAARST